MTNEAQPAKKLESDEIGWKIIRRSLFPLQTFIVFVIGTTGMCFLIKFFGRAAFEELAAIASVPINTALVFIFGMTVSRAVGARGIMHAKILRVMDFATTISVLASRDDNVESVEKVIDDKTPVEEKNVSRLVAEYIDATKNGLEIVRFIAYKAFADEVSDCPLRTGYLSLLLGIWCVRRCLCCAFLSYTTRRLRIMLNAEKI